MNSPTDQVVPEPFLINPLKHHAGFIREFIYYCKQVGLKESEFQNYLPKIGKSVVDIYYGTLSLLEIVENVKLHLDSSDCFSKHNFSRFIHNSLRNFKNIKVKDGSEWTMLITTDADRYIHLHPARGGVFTVRSKATALKTAILLKTYFTKEIHQKDFVSLVNEIRVKFLNESPIIHLDDAKGVRKVLELL